MLQTVTPLGHWMQLSKKWEDQTAKRSQKNFFPDILKDKTFLWNGGFFVQSLFIELLAGAILQPGTSGQEVQTFTRLV